MIRKLFLYLIILSFSGRFGMSQFVVRTSDLFQRQKENSHAGRLKIIQAPSIDTLISRYILVNKNLYVNYGYYGMEGYRIQIYSSNNRNAREEANKVKFEFINKFPGIASVIVYDNPGYFKVRVGDFRSKTEATKLYLMILKVFPDSYFIPNCFINFPDLNTK
jgi:SPOR domain